MIINIKQGTSTKMGSTCSATCHGGDSPLEEIINANCMNAKLCCGADGSRLQPSEAHNSSRHEMGSIELTLPDIKLNKQMGGDSFYSD